MVLPQAFGQRGPSGRGGGGGGGGSQYNRLYDTKTVETVTGEVIAVKELQHSGFDMKKLSIVGRDQHTDEHVVGYYNAGDRMKYWGKMGAFWGGIWGWLFGSAFFLNPGVGPLIVAGPLVGWIVGALEGAMVVGGLSAIGAGLYGLGIPKYLGMWIQS